MNQEQPKIQKYAVLFLILFILSFILFVTFMTLYFTKSSTVNSNAVLVKNQQESAKIIAEDKKKILQQRSLYEMPQNPFDKFDRIYYKLY